MTKTNATRAAGSSAPSCSLPDWHDAEAKMHRGEKLTALEQFIMDNEPANPVEADRFREQVAAVLREANDRLDGQEGSEE